MHQSYRAFTLEALRTAPLDIAEQIAHNKAIIEHAQNEIDRYSTRLILGWGLGLSLFVSSVVGLLTFNFFVWLILMVIFSVISFSLWRVEPIKERVVSTHRYDDFKKDIKLSSEKIEEVMQKAISYQKRMEFEAGPGFIACFSDVLLHEHYPSFFPYEERERFVRWSIYGQGQNIGTYEYGRLLFELKGNGIGGYVAHDGLVEQVPSQGKYSAAIAFARLIGKGTSKSTADEVCFAARVGLNAWLSYQAQGRPNTWDVKENDQWDIVKVILQQAEKKNTMGLARALSEYDVLDKKSNKSKNT